MDATEATAQRRAARHYAFTLKRHRIHDVVDHMVHSIVLSLSRHRELVTGHWSQVTGGWSLERTGTVNSQWPMKPIHVKDDTQEQQ